MIKILKYMKKKFQIINPEKKQSNVATKIL
jgi:hypothetical protein